MMTMKNLIIVLEAYLVTYYLLVKITKKMKIKKMEKRKINAIYEYYTLK